jgi:hypothetical protein
MSEVRVSAERLNAEPLEPDLVTRYERVNEALAMSLESA